MRRTEDLNVVAVKPLITPRELKQMLPMTAGANTTVVTAREAIRNIIGGKDERLLAVVGPCSIHDPSAALEYATRLNQLREELRDRLCIVMRTYFEKPRTTVGWKGLINDPNLNGSCDMRLGLRKAREVLIALGEMGMPTATEILDPIVPQYIADLVAWASLGARTTESQPHREMASGLSMPVGFKNSTDGNLQIAINAIVAARRPHHFLGIDGDGRTGIVVTRGNPWGHIILRGGRDRPNYDPVSVTEAAEQLKRAKLEPVIMVDCSHANCGRRAELQAHVLKDVVLQRVEDHAPLIGVMIESNLHAGRQALPDEPGRLAYGVSITDPCLDWETTAEMLRYAHERLSVESVV